MIIELRKWFKSLLPSKDDSGESSSKAFSERTCSCSLIQLFPEDEFVKKFPIFCSFLKVFG